MISNYIYEFNSDEAISIINSVIFSDNKLSMLDAIAGFLSNISDENK